MSEQEIDFCNIEHCLAQSEVKDGDVCRTLATAGVWVSPVNMGLTVYVPICPAHDAIMQATAAVVGYDIGEPAN